MPYTELDPLIAWKAIEGYEDVLQAEAKGLDAFYRQFRCPRCKGELQKEFDGRHAFSDSNTANPRALLRCPNCRFLTEPHTNLVLESGSPAKIPLEAIPILKTE
jgi:hypothetical protein